MKSRVICRQLALLAVNLNSPTLAALFICFKVRLFLKFLQLKMMCEIMQTTN